MRDKRKHPLRTHVRPELHDQLIEMLIASLDDEYPDEAYLRQELLSKFVSKDTDPADVRRTRAIEKWLATDDRNRRTNERMYFDERDFGFATLDDILEFARQVIKGVLGETVPLVMPCMYSGGATTSRRRAPGLIARKFTGQADVTEDAWPFVQKVLSLYDGWTSIAPEVLKPRFVRGNVMFTVPKSTVIDRCACKEPDLNMFVQRGIGEFIRHRLKAHGIDLNNQSINRELARRGSADGSLATLDLSSASDSISTGLVARLLPPDWFVTLDSLRSKETLIDDTWHENAMFSSMGNGFTFELESLIFWALCRSVAYYSNQRGRISVYGDDIIVPSDIARRVARVFSFCGFTVNTKKSHWQGPFRESCGGHYYGGADITPFYVKEPIDNLNRLIHFLNRLRKWASRRDSEIADAKFYPIWEKGAAAVPRVFWGGIDCANPEQLVARVTPVCKLQSVKSRRTSLELTLSTGRYLHTLHSLSMRPRLFHISVGDSYDATLPSVSDPSSLSKDLLQYARLVVDDSPSRIEVVRENEFVARRVPRSLKSFRYEGPAWYTPTGLL